MALTAAAVTARDLIGGLLICFAVGSVMNGIASPLPIWLRRTLAAVTAAAVLSFAGRLWGRHVAQLAGLVVPRHVTRIGLAVGGTTVVIGLGLAGLEPGLVAHAAAAGLPVHAVYTMVFVPATGLIAAIGAFALGQGLREWRLGVRLSLGAGLCAAGAFLVTVVVMDALGWRVGAPQAAERATMLVVTAISAAAAAILSGAAIGYLLSRASAESLASGAAA